MKHEKFHYHSLQEITAKADELNAFLPLQEDTSPLFQPLNIGGHISANRIALQPMEGSDGLEDGTPGELTWRRYERFAKGGAGLIWFEAVATVPEGRASAHQLMIHEKNLDEYKRLVETIKETGLKENGYEPVIVMQATNSGRYSKPTGVPDPLIAYHCPPLEDPILDDSRILTDDQLKRYTDAYENAAKLSMKAGFDGLDVKCCHRYLLCELLSAYDRPGRYGGSFENRTRLFREAVKGSIDACSSDFLVTSRMNLYDGYEYPLGFSTLPGQGTTPDYTEAIALVRELASYGVKLLNFTMGNPYFNPHVNRPYARGGYEHPEHPMLGCARMHDGIAEVAAAIPEVAVISSGLSYMGTASAHVAAGYIEQGKYAFAGFGREVLAYPDVARDLLRDGKMYPEKVCMACSMCTEIMRKPGGTPGCVLKDAEIYAPLYRSLVLGK